MMMMMMMTQRKQASKQGTDATQPDQVKNFRPDTRYGTDITGMVLRASKNLSRRAGRSKLDGDMSACLNGVSRHSSERAGTRHTQRYYTAT